jgi:hypothetical protein
LGLILAGFAAVGAIQFFGAKGSLAALLGAFAAFTCCLDVVSFGTVARFSRLGDQPPESLEVFDPGRASLGRAVSYLVVSDPTHRKVKPTNLH